MAIFPKEIACCGTSARDVSWPWLQSIATWKISRPSMSWRCAPPSEWPTSTAMVGGLRAVLSQQHSRWFSRGIARVARRLCGTLPRNESGAALVREPAPEPVDEHEQSIAESDEKVEVNDPPQQPRQDALELEPAQVRN